MFRDAKVSYSSLDDHSVELVHIFERRKSIIDAAIVRLLKREKEQTVDTVAMKVLLSIN